MCRKIFASLAAGVLAVSCAGRAQIPADPPSVTAETTATILASAIVPTTDQPRESRMSGISGLTYDRERDEWIAVSDDGRHPRWFVSRMAVDGGQLRIMPGPPVTAMIPASDGGGRRVDFEAVVALPGGDLLMASEGEPPSIMRFTRQGRYVTELRLPDRFLPASPGALPRGLRDNHGFEGLALSPDGSRLWAIAEWPLLQDDDPANGHRGARTRLVEFVRRGESFVAARDLVYPIDRVALAGVPDNAVEVVDQGVSELTMLADGALLSMERGFVRDTARDRSWNVIRVFRLALDDAEDVSGVQSLRRTPAVRTVRKTLVADLGSLASALPPRLARLENFEAMVAGPLVDGARSLLIMSDDNFRPAQVTAAVLLRLP